MTSCRCLLFLGVAALALSPVPARTQSVTTSAVEVLKTDRVGRVITTDTQQSADGFDVSTRPTTLDLRKLPPEIRERLRRFEVVREAYLKEQEELRKKLRGAATEAERDRVRELIRQNRQEWLERSRQLREESLRRMRELPAAMPDLREVISNARDTARDNASEIRRRRGQD